MVDGPEGTRGNLLAKFLPERRIYIRGEGSTRQLVLSPLAQAIGALSLGALLSWSAFTTVAYVQGALEASRIEAHAAALRAGLELRARELTERQAALEATLAALGREKASLAAALERKQARLTEAQAGLAAAEKRTEALHRRIAELTAGEALGGERLAAREGEIAALRRALARAAARNSELEGALADLGDEMERVLTERDEARARVAALAAENERMSAEITEVGERQERLLATLETATREGLASLTKAFARTNVDVERLLGDIERDFEGAGGPFVPVEEEPAADIAPEIDITAFEFDHLPPAGEAATDPDMRVAALVDDIGTLDMLRYAAERMPFGAPVEIGRFTSGFGVRRDPRTGRRAFHEGVDIAGPRGTPIHATGDGIVVFAGRQRGYGIVVKIRHAFGFETVYAHLRRARVKVGQEVKRGDRIGDMGNTGRSTGPHVHYEVRIDDKPVNPMKFIEAARDVL